MTPRWPAGRWVNWDAWWVLMDKIQQFPYWVRKLSLETGHPLAEIAMGKDTDAIRREVGITWHTLAVAQSYGLTEVWGYFEGDEERLLDNKNYPRWGAGVCPDFLKGMEE